MGTMDNKQLDKRIFVLYDLNQNKLHINR